MTITVYSKPRCPQCDATTRTLDQMGAPYKTVDITVDRSALEMILGLGYQQAPVVIAGDEHWSGFRPDMVKQVAARALELVG